MSTGSDVRLQESGRAVRSGSGREAVARARLRLATVPGLWWLSLSQCLAVWMWARGKWQLSSFRFRVFQRQERKRNRKEK